jgi:hypothetical protein
MAKQIKTDAEKALARIEASKKAAATRAAKKVAVSSSSDIIAGKVIKSLPDQKGRLVDLVHVGAGKHQVIKTRTGFASEKLSLDEAEKVFAHQRLNPHHK